jgi:pilus assembly protein CpaF
LSGWDHVGLSAHGTGSLGEAAHPAGKLAGGSSHAASFYALKTLLHQKLLTRMDLSAAENLPADRLREQLSELVVRLIDEDALPVNSSERRALVTELQNEILGLGPIEPLLADPTVTEIMVNGCEHVYVERDGRIQLTAIRFNDDDHVKKIIDKIVSRIGRRIDESSPMADARLPDGSRVNAVIPPIALDGPSLSIRRFAVVPLRMDDLIQRRALTAEMAEFLAGLVRAKVNIIISGGTGSGKTTLLNILSSYIPENERIITIEDTAELQMQQPHVVRMETRPPNVEGRGEIAMRALVRNSLRMRPDRIVLGEVRGAEVVDMLQAMNTGHEGSMGTLHANSPDDALQRLMTMITMSGVKLGPEALAQIIGRSLHVIVQANRLPDGQRKITSITEVLGLEADRVSINEVFAYRQEGVDDEGRIIGEHAYVNEAQFLERFYRSGALKRPGAR